jgi:hypothetical protein
MFVRSTGEVQVSTCQGRRSPQTFVMMHAELASTAGQRVGLCLFGSMDNLRGRLRDTDNFEAGSTSSAVPAIDELLATRTGTGELLWHFSSADLIPAITMACPSGGDPVLGVASDMGVERVNATSGVPIPDGDLADVEAAKSASSASSRPPDDPPIATEMITRTQHSHLFNIFPAVLTAPGPCGLP